MLAELNALLLSIAERGTIARADSAAAFADALRTLHDSGLTMIDPGSTIEARVVLRALFESGDAGMPGAKLTETDANQCSTVSPAPSPCSRLSRSVAIYRSSGRRRC
jgi:hypothetical protein